VHFAGFVRALVGAREPSIAVLRDERVYGVRRLPYSRDVVQPPEPPEDGYLRHDAGERLRAGEHAPVGGDDVHLLHQRVVAQEGIRLERSWPLKVGQRDALVAEDSQDGARGARTKRAGPVEEDRERGTLSHEANIRSGGRAVDGPAALAWISTARNRPMVSGLHHP
jgi:hypothetical protein